MADNDDFLIPVELSGSRPGIQKQDIVIKVYAKTVEGSKAAYAELSYGDGHIETCIAVCRKRSEASEIFRILNSCSHPNIAKPLGLWEDKHRQGYVIFPKFDGVLRTLPKEVIFETESLPGQIPAIYGFTETGLNIFSDIVAAIKYINDQYQQETTGQDNCIPLKALRIDKDKVFYQRKTDREYLVLLSEFDVEIVTQETKVSRRRAVENARSSDIHQIRCKNWNNLGKFIGELYEGSSAKCEVTHLVDLLQNKAVRYEDLIWEPGLWELSTKMHFIREIFWFYDKNATRMEDLDKRPPLGLQTCINMLEVNKKRSPAKQIIDKTLYNSLFFLRVFILAHQDEAWEAYSGPKVDIMDKKAVERFVLRHKDDYMVRLVKEMRELNWIERSPYLRCKKDYYMSVHYQTPEGK